MSDHTEFRLSQIDEGDLEDLAIDLLTRQDRYYGVDPQGGRGKDGGKDGLLLNGPDGANTIVHVSRREDWKRKIEIDLGKAADHDREYDTFVYITNQVITGNQKPVPDVAQPFVDEHGWEVDIWDGDRIRGHPAGECRRKTVHHRRSRYITGPGDETVIRPGMAGSALDQRISKLYRWRMDVREPRR